MNDRTRAEFEELKRRQVQLEQELAALSARLRRFEVEVSTTKEPAPEECRPESDAKIVAAATTPAALREPSVPPPIPPVISALHPAVGTFEALSNPRVQPPAAPSLQPAPETLPGERPPIQTSRFSEVEEKRSFEMRLGTYWLVRVGIVMLLTGLVFFGNYAYQNFIGRLGPAGKVSLLYLASALLLGFGAWWQRKAVKEALRNYAQVLFAGGLAAVYFTTYAAYHIPNLRIIENPILDGALLLGWAGFMVWIADRKRSEILALFAVGLAYYTSVITRVGAFTLYSNVILTAAAVFFLVKNRWAILSMASLVATYASYGFWRFFDGEGWHWATPGEGLWFGAYFLVSYWALFTAAVFLSRGDRLKAPGKAVFLTFNNGAFFALFVLTMLQVNTGGFWRFSLIFGVVLLALAELARRFAESEPLVKNSYLTQGLLLVTIGIISKFSGVQLALLLGAESVVLLTLGMARKNPILQVGSFLTGAFATGWGIEGLRRDDWRALLFESSLGLMMAFNAFWAHRQEPQSKSLIRPVPGFFVVLALISWLAGTTYNTSGANMPVALALEALVLTASVYVLRLRELTVFGQSFLVMGQFLWLLRASEVNSAPSWWNPLVVIAITLLLSHWWQRQTVIQASRTQSNLWQGVYALAIIGVLHFWLRPQLTPAVWLVVAAGLALAVTVYGVMTRAWLLAVSAQMLLAVSIGQFALQLRGERPDWFLAPAPIFALALLSIATVFWFQRNPGKGETVREPLLQLAQVYRWIAVLMLLWWVHEYVPIRERMWAFGGLGLTAFLLGGRLVKREVMLMGAVYWAAALAQFWSPNHAELKVYWPNLLAVVVLLGQQRLVRRFPERFNLDLRVQGAMIIVGGLSLWLFLSRWVRLNASGFYLTASWSALALLLFVAGMALRERVYRWLGLGILAAALGRVVIFDVWKLETLYRILSFMALGIVLLVLGFIYNKYQEKIREWL